MSSCLVYLLTLSGTQWTGEWVGPREVLDALKNMKKKNYGEAELLCKVGATVTYF